MEQALIVRRWRRYGADRLYVTADTGAPLGSVDLATGQVAPAAPDGTVLDDAVLDRIDEIVPPGTNLYQPDGAWSPPTLTDPSHRRRPLPDRAAA